MIVVDTNVLINLAFDDEGTSLARQWASIDSNWAVPVLWRHEFANAMLQLVKHDRISPDLAELKIATFTAELRAAEHDVSQVDAFRIARRYRLSIYDSNFIALAESLSTRCITDDQIVLERAKSPTRNFRFPSR